MYYGFENLCSSDDISHHGIKGQKWGIRRYQNSDGTLTSEGKKKLQKKKKEKVQTLNDTMKLINERYDKKIAKLQMKKETEYRNKSIAKFKNYKKTINAYANNLKNDLKKIELKDLDILGSLGWRNTPYSNAVTMISRLSPHSSDELSRTIIKILKKEAKKHILDGTALVSGYKNTNINNINNEIFMRDVNRQMMDIHNQMTMDTINNALSAHMMHINDTMNAISIHNNHLGF